MWRVLLRLSSFKPNRVTLCGHKWSNSVRPPQSIQLSADNFIYTSSVKSLWVHLDGFNFPTSPAADGTVKLPSVISVLARPTVFWEILEIFDCKMNIQANSCCSPSPSSITLFWLLYARMHAIALSVNRYISPVCGISVPACPPFPSFPFFFNVLKHLSNINSTGKKRPGCKEGHRRHGSARDQIRRHGLLHHACGNRTLAVVPGARCQIITSRTSEEEGELPPLCCGT